MPAAKVGSIPTVLKARILPGWLRFTPVLVGLALVSVAFGWSKAHPSRPMMVIEPGPTFRSTSARREAYGRHSWSIRNDDTSPLRLRTHFTSGRCGFSLWLGQERLIAPGESFVVSLTWPTPARGSAPFAGHAEVWTNDPDQPKVRFSVIGTTGPIE